MKKIICIVFLLSMAECWSQYPILRPMHMRMKASPGFSVEPGDYYKDMDNMHDAYIGTWKYTGNDKIFTVKLQKKNKVLFILPFNHPGGFYFYGDCIVLTYKLQNSDGSIIYDNTNLIPTDLYCEHFSYLDGGESHEYIEGMFSDFTTKTMGTYCEIKKIATKPGEPERVFFKLFRHDALIRIIFDTTSNHTPPPLYSVPNRVVLIKQP